MEPTIPINTVFDSSASSYKGKSFRNGILVLIVATIIIGQTMVGTSVSFADVLSSWKILLLFSVMVSFLTHLFLFKRIYKIFSVSEAGISIENKLYPWSDLSDFHMLGDSQDERLGIASLRKTGGYDPLNPFMGLNVFVIKPRSWFASEKRLQLSPEKVAQFMQILTSHNINRETKMHMWLTGINKWFIYIFAVPFGLIALYMLYLSFTS